MGSAVRALLPMGLAVAISPLPIAAAILMLLAPRAHGRSGGLLIGWTAGIVLATGISFVAVEAGNVDGARAATTAGWLQLAVGVLLIAVGIRHWTRPRSPAEPARVHSWMAAIGTLTPTRGATLGLVLCAASPKNLTLCVAAGVALAGQDLQVAPALFAAVVFTGIAASTVAVPVLGYAVGADRLRGPLERAAVLLHRVSGSGLAVLLVVLGTLLAGAAINGLR